VTDPYKNAPAHVTVSGHIDKDGNEIDRFMTIYPNVDPQDVADALAETFGGEWTEELKRLL